MKNSLLFLMFFLSVSLQAQDGRVLQQAFDNFDYEKVLTLSKDKDDAESITKRISSLKALGRYTQLMNEVTSLFQKDSTNLKYCVEIADGYKIIGNHIKAALYYGKALQLQPANLYFNLQKIRSLINAEEYDNAIVACHDFLSRDTTSADVYKYLGQAYENKEDMTSAFFSYNIAYRRDSTNSDVVFRIAKIFNGNKQFEDAINITERYRLADTTCIDVNRQNALAYCMNGDYKKAIDRYESLKIEGDKSASTLYYLGVAYYGDNWFYGAYDNFKLAQQKNPSDVNVLYYLAKSSARTSWKNDGVDYMKKALEITVPSDSTLVWLYKGLADCCKYAGNRELRVQTLKQIYSLNHDYNIFYTIAGIYYLEKEYQKALFNYEKFISLLPESARKISDEGENQTKYQFATKRIREIKSEDFFKGDI